MLPPLSDLHRIECWLLHHGLHLKVDPPAGAAPAWSPLREERISGSATEESVKSCSREDSHLELPPSQSGVQDSYTSGALEKRASCRICPGAVSLEETHAAITPMTQKWWLLPVSHRTPLVFSEVLISLSYAAKKWSLRVVSRHGLPLIGRVLCF